MLQLTSDRWAELDSFFGDASDLPRDIQTFADAPGTDDEADSWATVRDYFLCQGTIKKTTAQAVIPHVIGFIARMAPETRTDAVIDIGIAEGARLKLPDPGLDPTLFADAYATAISETLRMALDLIPGTREPQMHRYLLSAVSFLSGHVQFGEILFTLDGVSAVCPQCGSPVGPSSLADSEYL